MNKIPFRLCIAGAAAGAANGLFGAGGGMLLVPLLSLCGELNEDEIFPTSVSIILPVCIISLLLSTPNTVLNFRTVLPYLVGSSIGGILAGIFGRKIPTLWLHRMLGGLILWGGIRYIC